MFAPCPSLPLSRQSLGREGTRLLWVATLPSPASLKGILHSAYIGPPVIPPAPQSVSLSVSAGETVALVGPHIYVHHDFRPVGLHLTAYRAQPGLWEPPPSELRCRAGLWIPGSVPGARRLGGLAQVLQASWGLLASLPEIKGSQTGECFWLLPCPLPEELAFIGLKMRHTPGDSGVASAPGPLRCPGDKVVCSGEGGGLEPCCTSLVPGLGRGGGPTGAPTVLKQVVPLCLLQQSQT